MDLTSHSTDMWLNHWILDVPFRKTVSSHLNLLCIYEIIWQGVDLFRYRDLTKETLYNATREVLDNDVYLKVCKYTVQLFAS